jgi:hypothetical protein
MIHGPAGIDRSRLLALLTVMASYILFSHTWTIKQNWVYDKLTQRREFSSSEIRASRDEDGEGCAEQVAPLFVCLHHDFSGMIMPPAHRRWRRRRRPLRTPRWVQGHRSCRLPARSPWTYAFVLIDLTLKATTPAPVETHMLQVEQEAASLGFGSCLLVPCFRAAVHGLGATWIMHGCRGFCVVPDRR